MKRVVLLDGAQSCFHLPGFAQSTNSEGKQRLEIDSPLRSRIGVCSRLISRESGNGTDS